MFKKLLTSILLIMSLTISSQVSTDNSIHQFKVADISENKVFVMTHTDKLDHI